MALSQHVIHALVHSTENLCHPICRFPAEGDEGDALPSYLSSHAVNKWPFHGLLNAMLVMFLCFFSLLLAVSVSEITHKHRAIVSSNVRNEKHAVKDLE